jgi:hypothetical protein
MFYNWYIHLNKEYEFYNINGMKFQVPLVNVSSSFGLLPHLYRHSLIVALTTYI